MHGMHVVDTAQFKRVVRQKGRKVVVVVAGQLVVQACQRITCGVWQPEARVARIAPTCRVRSVRCWKTCRTNNNTLVMPKISTKCYILAMRSENFTVGLHALLLRWVDPICESLFH